ncbi:MAG: hypothetical protein DLM68_09905 [Hyphomicrobiales bacterium]|nr:MAG: hypothetical protein DLM68_09905 [Hyphomicrobiales bacterium]
MGTARLLSTSSRTPIPGPAPFCSATLWKQDHGSRFSAVTPRDTGLPSTGRGSSKYSPLPFVLLLEPFVGHDGAILAAATMFGPILLGSLTAALWWAARPFVAWKQAMLFVPAAAVMAPALLAYGGAGRFGHHLIIPLCAMAFAHAFRAASGRGRRANSAIYAGLWCGIGTAFSVEMLPFALLAFAGLALAWVLDGDEAAAGRVEGCALGFRRRGRGLAARSAKWRASLDRGGPAFASLRPARPHSPRRGEGAAPRQPARRRPPARGAPRRRFPRWSPLARRLPGACPGDRPPGPWPRFSASSGATMSNFTPSTRRCA